MKQDGISRRGFLRTSAVVTGAAMLSAASASSLFAAAGDAAGVKRTATDQVQLGKTAIMLSRVGIGTGSNNGQEQTVHGQEYFTKLIHHAFDSGITYIDTAEAYKTFNWIAEATKGLPRERLFIQSKVDGRPDDVLAVIDRHRSVFKTDYIDSLLIHCMTKPGWTDPWKRIMDGFNEAQSRKWIRAKGVSCHTLPALVDGNKSDWPEVHLVRVNPQGKFMDATKDAWGRGAVDVQPVLDEIKSMHDKGRGVIGMKIMGNGSFTDPADREKSVRFAMANRNIDAIVIGMTSTQQVDENLALVNRALAAA
ncbi:MAG TPA: aldo/keto reductase [Tepidisphaeraceae bacterium]|nr:aldo/keto reductase [Tepidisphaeraceae bacterium]